MSHDPLRDAFERMAPPSVSPTEARDRLGALSPGFRTARRNHRIRTGIAGVTAAVALFVGGPVAIAAIAPGAPSAPVDFASSGEGTEDGADNEAADDASIEESVDIDTSSSSEDAPEGPTETTDSSDDDSVSDDTGSTEHDNDTLGQGTIDDDPFDHDSGDDSDSDSDSDGSDSSDTGIDSDDDDSDDDDSDSDDDDEDSPEGEAVVEGETYSMQSPGGTLSVRVVGGVLELVDATPASGFSAEFGEEDDEIRVDFSSGSEEFRIEVEYEHGQLFWQLGDD